MLYHTPETLKPDKPAENWNYFTPLRLMEIRSSGCKVASEMNSNANTIGEKIGGSKFVINGWGTAQCSGDEFSHFRKLIRPRLPKLANSKRFAKFDALVTSYEIFRKDHWLFQQIDWKVIIVDEGHRLKSFSSEVKRALESCKSEMRLLLTGTPLQVGTNCLECPLWRID